MAFADIFDNDAFSMTTLTARVNELDHVPGLAGKIAFSGDAEGVATTKVMVERQGESLKLVKTTPRGAPGEQHIMDKRQMLEFTIPHIELESVIYAASIQDKRRFGSEAEFVSMDEEVGEHLASMNRRFDTTLENMQLGALKGEIKDADGTPLFNLFTEFGVAQPDDVYFDLDNYSESEAADAVRIKCHNITRHMERNIKLTAPSLDVWCLCGDNFFDKLVEHPSVKNAYDGHAAASQRLGESYINGVFEFGGVFFKNYRGTDDATTVTIPTEEAQFFCADVPGLYIQRFAPADTVEDVNQLGLPRYSRIILDPNRQKFARLIFESNPLVLCTRPRTLVKGHAGAESA